MSDTRREPRHYTREFKLEAVRAIDEPGNSLSKVARNLDICPKMLRRWRKELTADPKDAFPGKGRLKPDEEKVRRLEQEVERLRMERDILKKAVGIFSGSDRR